MGCADKSRARIAIYVTVASLSVLLIILLVIFLGFPPNSSSDSKNTVVAVTDPSGSLNGGTGVNTASSLNSSTPVNLTAFESSSNAFIINFLTKQAYGHNLLLPLNQTITFSRSGAADALNLAGAIVSFAENIPRITDSGLFMEPATTLLLQNAFSPQNWTSCSGSPIKLPVNKGFFPLQYSNPKGGGDCTPPTFPAVAGQPFAFRFRYSAASATYNSNATLNGALRLDVSIGSPNGATYGYVGGVSGTTLYSNIGTFNNTYRSNTYIGNGVWEYEHVLEPTVTGSCKMHLYATAYPPDGAPVIMYGLQVESGYSLSSWSTHNVRNAESASYTAQVQTIVNSASSNHVYAMDYTGAVTELTKASALPSTFKNIVKIGVFSFALTDSQKQIWAYQKKVLRGINLSGAEFDGAIQWPSNDKIDYYAGRNVDNIRLPFLWERMQSAVRGALTLSYVQEMDRIVARATITHKMTIQLDMHNYDRFNGNVIGETGGANAGDYSDVWSKIASRYVNNSLVVIGLMNEPHSVNETILVSVQAAAATAIRATGFKGLILLSASGYTGATQFQGPWAQDTYAPSVYPSSIGPVAMDIHCYLDSDSSGTHAECVAGVGGANRLGGVTQWARKNQVSLYLGEFAAGFNTQCAIEVANHINYMESNRDVWKGWTLWGADFPTDYYYALDPTNGVDAPLMAYYTPYFNKTF